VWDRLLLGLGTLVVNPKRLCKLAVIVKPKTLLKFHQALKKHKYRLLFSSSHQRRPGPKGPSRELIAAIVEMKRRNPKFGCPRIAQQICHAFGIEVDKDVVRRVLAVYFHPDQGDSGPSWLTFIGHLKDGLWSVDLFRCESLLLKSHWVMVVMDVFTRRIIGFGAELADIDGVSVCRMFNRAIAGQSPPKNLSSDNDPLFRFHRWRANLRVLEIKEIKTVPCVPCSHPFVEADQDNSARVFGSGSVLQRNRLDPQARGIQDVLQRPPRAPLPRRRNTVAKMRRTTACPRRTRSICVAPSLSWALSHTDSRLTTNPPRTCSDFAPHRRESG
jgi:putative transposase